MTLFRSIKNIFTILTLLIIIQSCKLKDGLITSENNLYKLPGTITDCDVFYCNVIVSEKKTIVVPLRLKKYKPDRTYFNGLCFLDSTRFLAYEHVETISGIQDRSNLVVLNSTGEVVERLVD